MPDEVPWAQMYHVMAENDSSEVLRLAEHRVSVLCVLSLSSQLEGEVKPDDSVSQTSRSTKKFSSTAASSAKCNGACTGPELWIRA